MKKIPKGHVATYGQIAEMAGNPRMSRAVGNVLHKNPDPLHIPCFRVVNSKGELAGANAFEEDRQKALEAGMNEHVSKPIDMERLLEIMKKVLK